MLSRLLLLQSGKTKPFTWNKLRWNSSGSWPTTALSQELQPDVTIMPQIIPQRERKFIEGKQYRGFECIRSEDIPDLDATSYKFQHVGVGTELWYLDSKDTNNVFSIHFRTPPSDSTGLPHMIEHIVQTGSHKYPLRESFSKMMSRSVASHMDTIIAPDYTGYPFASMNETDFRNLQSVYLDAVFRPNMEYIAFLEECWRLEHSDLHDKESEYVLKGVVLKEMKAAFSQNNCAFRHNLRCHLMPDNAYGHIASGKPLEIPKASYDNMINFHKKYYHPSNARIFTYGSFDLNKTLEFLNSEYLSNYRRKDNAYSRVLNQVRWQAPRKVHVTSRFDNMRAPLEKQNQIAIALLMTDVTNVQETFTLYVLAELLLRGPSAPFYKSLIEPNFSGGYNQRTGYDRNFKDTYFCVGLQDLHADDFERVEQAFDTTVRQVIEEGFEPKHIESVLHNIELSLQHQRKLGIDVLFDSMRLWNHEGDTAKNLCISHMIAEFRARLALDSKLLQRKVEHYLAGNPHKLTLTMAADVEHQEKLKAAESELIKEKLSQMDRMERDQIYENGLKLEEAQKAVTNAESVLPCLHLQDVMEPPKQQPIVVVQLQQVPTHVCTAQTNGTSYFKCYFDGSTLKRDEVLLMPLFCHVISGMGTERHEYQEFDEMVLAKTAGINFKQHFAENINDGNTYNLGVLMTTYALNKNVPHMLALCKELLTKFKLQNTERLSMLVNNYVSNISTNIFNTADLHVMQSCAGLVTDSAHTKSLLAGVGHIDFMKQYIKDHKMPEILQSLRDLGHKLFNKKAMRCAVTTSADQYATFMEHYEHFLRDLPTSELKPVDHKVHLLPPSHLHYVMNSPVSFCAKSFYTVPYMHQDHPTLRVLAKLIAAKYIVPVVREQNDCDEADARIGSDGIFHLYSYRDPDPVKSLGVFENTYQWLTQQNTLSEQTLLEAKFGVLKQLDAPGAAGNQGSDFFLYGLSQEMSEKYRERVLSVTLPELKAVVERYFKDQSAHYGKCILGPENKQLQQQTQLKWKTIF